MRVLRTSLLLFSFWYLFFGYSVVQGQNVPPYQLVWMDIGEMHSQYSELGAHTEAYTQNRGLEWPAILRQSGQIRAKAYWIGVRDWVDEQGTAWDYRVAQIGLRTYDLDFYIPIEQRLMAKFEDTRVIVDGQHSFDKIAVVDEVDPDLPADRVLYQRYRSFLGVETERWVYAYAHRVHDDYHIIRRRMINTGNTDRDANIELPRQSLNDVYFYNAYRWVIREQAARHGGNGSLWGKFAMVDVVGDGNEEYPVDFTAIYHWGGYDPAFQLFIDDQRSFWTNIGSPMLRERGAEAPGDTLGRLAAMSMQGRMVLHADNSPTDRTYDPENQPHTMGFLDNDEPMANVGSLDRDYYELGILTRENPARFSGGSSRMYPHLADRIEPGGAFWDPTSDASVGKAGGHSATLAYGPYQMAFQDTINIIEAEGSAGLSYKAATDIGAAYKSSGFDDEALIPFDANSDGEINEAPWDYDVYKNGSELLTKNQWVLTSRDSIFQFMYRARDVWEASNSMSEYPIIEPPRPPKRFEITSLPDRISLSWESMPGSPDPELWELYRTASYKDNIPYEQIAVLPGSARSFSDLDVIRGEDYYYFIQAVGSPNDVDEKGITGTPGGLPLKSGRYLTQSHHPAGLIRSPGSQVSDFRIVPNPINLAADDYMRFFADGDPDRGQIELLDIPGQSIITLYTEVGEKVNQIVHTDGSGNITLNLITRSGQPFVSGIYLVHVLDQQTGAVDVKKLVVIK